MTDLRVVIFTGTRRQLNGLQALVESELPRWTASEADVHRQRLRRAHTQCTSTTSHRPRRNHRMTVCEHCGCDPHKASFADHYERRYEQLRRQHERAVATSAVEVARLHLAALERDDDRKGLQRKVAEQRRAIRRLEGKLRKLGVAPYAPEGGADA